MKQTFDDLFFEEVSNDMMLEQERERREAAHFLAYFDPVNY